MLALGNAITWGWGATDDREEILDGWHDARPGGGRGGKGLCGFLGPAVGATAPAIEAEDQDGQVRDLASLSGERGVLLVLSRSADW